MILRALAARSSLMRAVSIRSCQSCMALPNNSFCAILGINHLLTFARAKQGLQFVAFQRVFLPFQRTDDHLVRFTLVHGPQKPYHLAPRLPPFVCFGLVQ